MIELDAELPADAIALVADNGERVPLSGPDAEGYQTPERYDFTAVAMIVRVLPAGHLLQMDLPQPMTLDNGNKVGGLTPLSLSSR